MWSTIQNKCKIVLKSISIFLLFKTGRNKICTQAKKPHEENLSSLDSTKTFPDAPLKDENSAQIKTVYAKDVSSKLYIKFQLMQN